MAENIKKGKVASVLQGKTGSTGWVAYTVTFDTGEVIGVSCPPDNVKAGKIPLVGVTYDFLEGKFGKYVLANNNSGEAAPGSTPTGSSYKKDTGAGTKDNYWANKTDYEEKIRDPKIEKQFYAKLAADLYAAALPFLEEDHRPTTVEQLDDFIGQAFDKGAALYDIANK
jgi:hypothetical protein